MGTDKGLNIVETSEEDYFNSDSLVVSGEEDGFRVAVGIEATYYGDYDFTLKR